MNDELSILKEVAGKLDDNKIPYLLSGSMAANYYTVPRMTRDIDFVIVLKTSDVQDFIGLFDEDYYCDFEAVSVAVKDRDMFNLIHKEYAIKVDFILHKATEFQEAMFQHRKKITIENFETWIISCEDLVLMKMLWAKDSYSELQINDVRNLMKTHGTLDKIYVDDWIARLELHEVNKRVLQ